MTRGLLDVAVKAGNIAFFCLAALGRQWITPMSPVPPSLALTTPVATGYRPGTPNRAPVTSEGSP
ncbi:hypothetical protein ACFYZ8_32915 [Streptomyces sp. NPDC001668]|uniref:hypothetical protein n=1 Tax=unclassified Streptomyces TaxID=2593676 RepID=UPI0033C11031